MSCPSSIRVKIGSRQVRTTTRAVIGRTATVRNCRGKVPRNGTTRVIGLVHRKECSAGFSGQVLKPGKPEQPKPRFTELNLTVLFCFPITDHVKYEMLV